jgi:hypothetical protein
VNVIQMPQAIGTPTAIQARTEVVSSRHAPMPMETCGRLGGLSLGQRRYLLILREPFVRKRLE